MLQVPGQIFALFAASRELVDGNNNRASRKGREDAKGQYRPATELRAFARGGDLHRGPQDKVKCSTTI
ncbi:protein of unknown function [Methanoculleus bourgensis]|uniref:Uncharacterized protein n=1 Tax=Methanoculleus bourgensis TaxID=83986 RepID=A0A0X3BIP1_9EURY|nr:protein of unknown function [Methanoculleus bourgensis]